MHLTLCGKRRLLIPVRPTGLYERSGGRLQDGVFTIEAVAAKVAVPRARALQTPAGFSPTPESTEFVPFCSLSPHSSAAGFTLTPCKTLGTLGFSSRTTEKDISLFPIFCFVQLCSMPGCFFVSLKIKRSFLAMEKENDYGPRVKFQLLTFLIWQPPISSVRC